MTVDEFFVGHDDSRRIFDALARMVAAAGPAGIRVSKSQIAFRRRTAFGFAWMPELYLGRKDVPLVVTIALRRRDDSPRWKQVVEPSPGRFTHHLELRYQADVDESVARWLREAWEAAA
jgi:hypothetical protein